MKTSVSLTLAALLLVAFTGCEHSNPALSHPEAGYRYPLSAGSSWQYLVRNQEYSASDSAFVGYDEFWTLEVTGRNEYAPGRFGIRVISYLSGNRDDDSMITENWYEQREDGLYAVAYRNAGSAIVTPKRGNSIIPAAGLLPFGDPGRSIATDSLIVEENPPLVLPSPMSIGFNWFYRRTPWDIEKTLVSFGPEVLHERQHHAFVVEWAGTPRYLHYTIGDLISDVGLLRRELNTWNAQTGQPESRIIAELYDWDIH